MGKMIYYGDIGKLLCFVSFVFVVLLILFIANFRGISLRPALENVKNNGIVPGSPLLQYGAINVSGQVSCALHLHF